MTDLRLPPLAQRSSRSDEVLTALRQAVLSGAYAPGDQLQEGNIAAELGVSKTPVREALASLRNSGLVEFDGSRRMSVVRIDPDMIRNLYEFRNVIEPLGVLKAVPLMDEAILTEARGLLAVSAAKGYERDLANLSASNRAFHELMCRRCGNPYVLSSLESIRNLVQFVAINGWLISSSWDLEWKEHQAILDAAADGDQELAAALTRKHIQNASNRLTLSD